MENTISKEDFIGETETIHLIRKQSGIKVMAATTNVMNEIIISYTEG